jgi:MFS family permease
MSFLQHPPSRSIGLVFSILSLLYASWVARIPEIKEKLALSESKLGVTLLGMSLGAILITPLSGWLLHKMPTGKAVFYSALGACLLMPFIAMAPSMAVLMGVLMIAGTFNSLMDVSMNAAADALEREEKMHIMSTCHGMFSFGGFVGAGLSGLMAALQAPLAAHLAVLSALLIGLLYYLKPRLMALPEGNKEGSAFVAPKKAIVLLAATGFCAMLAEGAVADWSAVYLKNYQHSNAFIASLGFALFSFMMAAGRFSGDYLRQHFSSKMLILTGSLTASAGMVLAALLPYDWTTIIGFSLAGAGLSVIVPLLFSEAAKVKGMSAGAGIASIATSGIVGFLVGPPFIGFIAESLGLQFGLGVVAGLAFLGGLLIVSGK